jgi:hypothetical protein
MISLPLKKKYSSLYQYNSHTLENSLLYEYSPLVIHRSNGNIVNVTPNQQIERFFTIFEDLMQRINQKNLSSFIFLDSNFDLLSLHEAGSSAFLNSILSAGYLQCVFKATRMQNNSRTLLDQILASCRRTSFESGTIITDLSDHFPTFILSPPEKQKNSKKTKTYRSFSDENMQNFKRLVNAESWDNVLASNDVNVAFDSFWSTYNELFLLNFHSRR